MLERIQTSYADLCTAYQLPLFDLRQFFTHAEALNIVFLPRAFQPAGETFDEHFVFVGPSLLPRQDAVTFPFERLGKQPVLYISLGTVFNEMTARRIEELGLGVALDQENLTAGQLREAITRIQQDPMLTQRVQAMRQTVHAAGGYQRAADAILGFANSRTSAMSA